MGFPLKFWERVPGTNGNRCCSRFSCCFSLFRKDLPPPTSFLSCDRDSKKKSRQKTKTCSCFHIPRARRWQRMTICSLCMALRQLRLLSNTQRRCFQTRVHTFTERSQRSRGGRRIDMFPEGWVSSEFHQLGVRCTEISVDEGQGVCVCVCVCVLLCFINLRVRKIRNMASSCPGIFSRTLRFVLR